MSRLIGPIFLALLPDGKTISVDFDQGNAEEDSYESADGTSTVSVNYGEFGNPVVLSVNIIDAARHSIIMDWIEEAIERGLPTYLGDEYVKANTV